MIFPYVVLVLCVCISCVYVCISCVCLCVLRKIKISLIEIIFSLTCVYVRVGIEQELGGTIDNF